MIDKSYDFASVVFWQTLFLSECLTYWKWKLLAICIKEVTKDNDTITCTVSREPYTVRIRVHNKHTPYDFSKFIVIIKFNLLTALKLLHIN